MSVRDRSYSLLERLRRALLGKPIPSSKAHQERLSPFIGLPVFSSDALSSVAYATEAILGVLILAGTRMLNFQLPISLAICGLILIIGTSYRQTIFAYPHGGGSYTVASDNLGPKAGLLAGAALLIDYILTVSVSVAGGVAALASAFPALLNHIVGLSLFFVAIVAWANLRGVRESGAMFAIPTYGFVLGVLVVVVMGVMRLGVAEAPSQHAVSDVLGKETHFFAIFVILRAFAAGCTALTGIEAVSNGVQAFKAPESKNAAKTLSWMVGLLTVMFLGIGILSRTLPKLELYTSADPNYSTLLSQIAEHAVGGKNWFYFYVQIATAAILVLAANTSFADFPRLSSLIARDGYMPRALARQGDRLVFHNGIVLLAIASGALIWYFKGQLDLLLPLYAVGVFTAFTLSQAGMVVHWMRNRVPGWKLKLAINGTGVVLTAIVTVVILVTKFVEGAYLVVILLLILFSGFLAVKRMYMSMSRQLDLGETPPKAPSSHTVIVLVSRVQTGALTALEYALLIEGDVQAVHVLIDEKRLPELRAKWDKFGEGVPLIILSSPYRSLIGPVMDYIDELTSDRPDQIVTVIVPEAVSQKWWHRVLAENVGLQLKLALSLRKNVVVTNVRYFLT